MQIKHKDKEYQTKPFDIRMKQAYMLAEKSRLQMTNEIKMGYDLTAITRYEKEIADLQNGVDIHNKLIQTEPENATQHTVDRDQIQSILDDKQNEFNSNVLLQNIKSSFNTEVSYAWDMWLTDSKVMKPFAEAVLDGDLSGIDWNDFDIDGLFSQCVSFFYSEMAKRRKELLNSQTDKTDASSEENPVN
jgi:hypothetical protein